LVVRSPASESVVGPDGRVCPGEDQALRRPYVKLRIGELTDLVDDPNCTAETRGFVAAELRHRSTTAARNLLARLEGGAAGSVDGRRRNGGAPAHRGGLADDRSASDEVAPHVLERDAVLAALRETYTEGSEVLARWGVTTAAPEELFERVVAWWKGVVSAEPDRFGRSAAALDADVARLRSLGWYTGGGGASDD